MSAVVATTPKTDAPASVFASFRLGDNEFAVDVRHVQEVVRRPTELSALPMLPDYAQGVFNLRGTIIPLLNTGRLLGRGGDADSPDARVAIVHHRGVRLGLTCDDTSRMLRPRTDEYAPMRYSSGSQHPITSGVLKLTDGLVPVIDFDQLLALQDIPFNDADEATGMHRRVPRARKRCITFRTGRSWMALPIGEIHEILRAEELQPAPLADPAIVGVMRRRDRVIPVMRLASVLHAAAEHDATAHENEQRVIVLPIGMQLVGFLVDTVEAIEGYHDDECMAVPVLSAQRARMFSGSVELAQRGLVFLLNRAGLGEDEEVARVAEQYRTLFAGAEADANGTAWAARGSIRSAYLWFRAETEFALPMREIREIVSVRDPLIPIPGAPEYVRGMLNLRGQIVTVVDARAFFEFDAVDGERANDHTILVLEEQDTLVGFSVDKVESILHLSTKQRLPIPSLLRAKLPPALREDIREVVRLEDAGDRPVDLLVLNVARLLDVMREVNRTLTSGVA